MRPAAITLAAALALAACTASDESGPSGTPTSASPSTGSAGEATTATQEATGADGLPFAVTPVAEFDEPWAMTFLPGTSYAAITERGGRLLIRDMDSGQTMDVENMPEVVAAGQGGLGDVIPGPTYADDGTIYLSWVEEIDGGATRAIVAQCRLEIDGDGARLSYRTTIWEQALAVLGDGHFSHRMAIAPDGEHLFITSGDRQQMTPAQDLGSGLGAVIRLTLDGGTPDDNPFVEQGYPAEQTWSYGHRNLLGLAFAPDGTLWESEMGPRGGDEVNVIERGGNYGWPEASNGTHYDGEDIPDHAEGDGFVAPIASWDPSISPGSLMVYSGDLFRAWQGDAFVGALSGQALIRVDVDGTSGTVGDEWPMGQRIREVEQGPDGSIWLLEDGEGGRLLQLTPPA